MVRSSRRRRSAGSHRKDRTLQARIPEHLDRELRSRADHLGLSVSTVVRNVLLHTFELVDGVVSDSAEVARALSTRLGASGSRSTPRDEPQPVVAWQEVVLNVNAVCAECNAILAKGARGALGMPVASSPVFLCATCLAGLTGPGEVAAIMAGGSADR